LLLFLEVFYLIGVAFLMIFRAQFLRHLRTLLLPLRVTPLLHRPIVHLVGDRNYLYEIPYLLLIFSLPTV